ncbi:MAG: alkaline phosphatase [Bacteroidia bacterium]
MKLKAAIFSFAIFAVLASCSKSENDKIDSEQVTAKSTGADLKSDKLPNIILVIGDGTGLSQISSLWYQEEDYDPNYGRFEYVGLSKTNSSSDKITDSGAGATAFAIGLKSYNNSIGVGPDSLARPNLVEILSEKGYNTGVISTSSITHATPASFYAHVKNRKMAFEIADALSNSEIDFFAGGGTKFFNKRTDDRNLIEEMIKKGFSIDTTSIETELNGDKMGYLLAADGMPRMLDGRGNFLNTATTKAIDFFSASDKPFFLMVEGSQVDWGGHANDMEYIVTELKDLDQTIGTILDFCEKDEETLVVALADHETGGFALTPKEIKSFGGRSERDYNSIVQGFTTGGHTAAHIPVFSAGFGAKNFTGIYENNKVFDKLLRVVNNE